MTEPLERTDARLDGEPNAAAPAAPGPDPAAVHPAATQEIRLAVVLNGGVSLAVWISGVTHELNRLVQASRRRGTPGAPADAYADLLGVLAADARIDVIAGTSAGGINGGFLALGLVHGCDLTGLRDLWQNSGALSTLLRSPRQKNQPSLLRGEYFHQELAKAYDKVWPNRQGVAAGPGEDVDLFLTGTLWEGRRSFFADDMGRRITEVNYDATFHFTSDPDTVSATPESSDRGDLHSPTVTAQLGVASRCTASFPAAFEPFAVNVDAPGVQQPDGRWPSEAGRTDFRHSQFVIDGGILRNKPIRPAIDAVYRQSADQQVRRILAYVVPDPGEPATGPGKPAVTALPGATDVILGVMTRLRSTDSVAEELAEIERRNHETAHRRRARDRLARTLVDAAAAPRAEGAADLVRSAYPGYLEVRRDDTAQSVAQLLLSAPREHPWSNREVASELRDLAADTDFPFIPQDDLDAAMGADPQHWRWGQATVRRLGDVVLDVLKRAVWLAPLTDDDRATIVTQRARAHEILRGVRRERATLDGYWRAAPLPNRSAQLTATPAELAGLRVALEALAAAWGTGPQAGMTSRLRGLAHDLAQCLLNAGGALRSISTGDRAAVDHEGTEQERLRALVDLLVPDGATADDVLRNMLRLEVVHVSFTGVSDVPEQAVELVQVSSLREELVTGIQLHHFGAFYRESWRANDWLRGRIDGSEQLVQMLLAPERLRQLGLTPQEAQKALRPVAVGPPGTARHAELAAAWDALVPRLTTELQVLEGDGPLPRTFPLTAQQIACRLRTELLPEELDSLATVVVEESDPVTHAVQWAAEVRADLQRHDDKDDHPGPAELDAMLQGSEVVGRQTIAEEANRGSDTFAQTATHATATLTATASSVEKPKAAVALLKALRGYALLLSVLVNFLAGKSHLGRNLTSLVVGVGGALVALAVVVPGVPIAVPLTGVVLVLAAASVSALRQQRLGGWRLVVRLVLLVLVAAAVLAAVLIQTASENKQSIRDLLLDTGLRVLLVAVVIGVGWFLGRPTRHAP
ncbi:MAG: patatin [Blastococcus sp.]|nr:patatin [Blastococcus sp.]